MKFVLVVIQKVDLTYKDKKKNANILSEIHTVFFFIFMLCYEMIWA